MKNLSYYSFCACIALILSITFIVEKKWSKPAGEAVIGWDVSGYYWYLPSLFIYHDLKQQRFADDIIIKYAPTASFGQSIVVEGGNKVITYTAGMAVAYFPFFTVAHLVAKPLGYPADGFSTPYQLAILLGSTLVTIIGLWHFRKLFLLYYSDKIVALMLVLLVFGTNYLNYSTSGLTHSWLFTIYVFILLNTYYFYQKHSYKYAIRVGLLTGFAVLIRPSEIVAILIPILWGMESLHISAIREKLRFLIEQWRKITVAAICAAAVAVLQSVYWLYVTGKPYVYSYTGNGFSWRSPHWFNYMLSYRSGWITYTPLAALFFIGIIPFLFKGRNKVAVLSFFAFNLYIVCSWNVWWYGGTGGRAMIQSYPVLFFILAALLQYILERKWLTYVAIPVISLLVYFNLWFTYNGHAGNGIFDADGMSKEYFWRAILRYEVPWQYDKLKDTPELFEGEPENMVLLYSNDFENDTNAIHNPVKVIEGRRSLFVAAYSESPEYAIPYTAGKAKWLRVQATFHSPLLEWDAWRMSQLVVRFKQQQQSIKTNSIRVHRFLSNGRTKDIYIDVKIPSEPFDTVATSIWSGECSQQIVIDNLKVWSFEE